MKALLGVLYRLSTVIISSIFIFAGVGLMGIGFINESGGIGILTVAVGGWSYTTGPYFTAELVCEVVDRFCERERRDI